MSDAYYHHGLTIEFDISVPRLAIDGRELPTEQLVGLFSVSESPAIKAERLRRYGEETIEGSPGFRKRESTRQAHSAILKRGVPEWNKWRAENPEIRPLLYDCDLTRESLLVDLNGADFSNAVLINSDLHGQNLRGANFHEANLGRAKLHGADLTGANFCRTDLYETELPGAILSGANLQGTQLVKTNLEGAELIGCRIYGMSAWDLKLDRAVQRDLIIRYRYEGEGEHTGGGGEDQIAVDNLEVAQFIYLLLHNRRIRRVIDTITSKVVLILGRFTPGRKAVLEAVREELRKHGYLPVLFDFEKPASQDFIETVSTLAHMAKFVVADLTDPKVVLEEVPHIVRNIAVPVQPLMLEGAGEEPVTLYNLRRNHRSLLDTYRYQDLEDLLGALGEKVIAPAEARGRELRGS